MPPVRVRFCPSPTGFLHVGGVRTALYNWLVARQSGGVFVLRIEDTDDERNTEAWVEGIDVALRWVGLDWDERYRQSERAHLYSAAADRLADEGKAYYCDCTREEVDARAKARGGPPGYDSHCREREVAPGEGVALRFRTPDTGVTVVEDVVRGGTSFDNANLDDPVIVRANGKALFLLANVVDDLDMSITHVLRGEEHLPTTPKYLLLRAALAGDGSMPPPTFAHLPVIVNEARQKLSKRRDPVALELYRDEGYLPEVVLNYLALIGWGPADGRERLTLDEMVTEFRLEDVGSSPGFFDVAKMRAFNGDTIRALSVERFIELSRPFIDAAPWSERFDADAFAQLAPLVQERVAVLGEVPAMVDFLFLAEPEIDEAAWTKAMKEPAPAVLAATEAAFADCEWEAQTLHTTLAEVGDGLGLNLRKTQAPVRAAVTGRSIGPPLFESLAVLGRERTLTRLRAARAKVA